MDITPCEEAEKRIKELEAENERLRVDPQERPMFLKEIAELTAELERCQKRICNKCLEDDGICKDCWKMLVTKKTLELEAKLERAEKVIEERGYAFQEAQNKTLLKNAELEEKLEAAREAVAKIENKHWCLCEACQEAKAALSHLSKGGKDA